MAVPDLDAFYRQNPTFDLRSFNFQNRAAIAALNWRGLDEADTLAELKRRRRVANLHPDPAVAAAMLAPPPRVAAVEGVAGIASAASVVRPAAAVPPAPAALSSAHQIVSQSRGQFVTTYAPHLPGDGTAVAHQIYDNAVGVQARVAHQIANISQLRAPHTVAMAATNAATPVADYYAGLPGYDELFGSLNYCDCEECKSIFGPAAYFVDLMRIIDQYATKPNAATIPHGMFLAERRPDLADIKLTCENTNQLMPYLTIVNQRLEATVKTALNVSDDLYATLAQTKYPFALPFQLPLERIRIYLRQLKVDLADIYATLEPSTDKLARASDGSPVLADDKSESLWAAEALGLSHEEWTLLTQAKPDAATLAALYGVSDLAQLSDPNVFCNKTNLLPTDLQALLNQNLSAAEITAGLQGRFFINQGLAHPIALQTQNGQQTIVNLADSTTALDQVHRFLRLALKLGWSYADLDWALQCVTGGAPAITAASLAGLARLNALAARLAIPIPSAAALVFDLRTWGIGDDPSGSQAPFDQVFNRSGSKPFHPTDSGAASYKLNATYKDPFKTWTIGATDTTNAPLATWVAAGLKLKPDDLLALARLLFPPALGASSGPAIALSVANLSLFARHVALAAQLGLPMLQYVKLLGLLKVATNPTTPIIAALVEQAARLRRSRMTVFELAYVATGTADPSVDILYRPQDVGPWLATLSDQVTATAADARTRQVTGLVAAFLGARPEQIAALFPFTGQTDMAGLFLDATKTSDQAATIVLLSRLMVLVRKLQLGNDEIASIGSAPAGYGIADLKALTAANVLDIFGMKETRAAYGDDAGHFLDYIGAANDAAAIQALVALTSQPVDQVKSALGLFVNANRIARWARTQRVLKLGQRAGLDFAFLKRLRELTGAEAKARWNDYVSAADDVLAALRARSGTSDWDALYRQLDGSVQERKRTALIGTALNALGQRTGTEWIKTTRNLYEYLLIDVEMGGTTQISIIKEGLNATQLYLLRCRDRLEPGVTSFAIPTVWWEWMMNYRIWEANRKIFVYPESYFDPALRHSKTKLFADLENTLKQGDIDDTTVGNAFTKYLDGFAELAKLRYVDACYYNVSDDTRDDAPTMYFVARTETQPWKYYYTICDIGTKDRVWSEWLEIPIGINSAHVTPIYAFNRLFLFWVEQKQYDDRSGTDPSSFKTMIKGTIKYSFYNFSGEWVQPQTLVADAVISEGGSQVVSQNATTFPTSLFDPTRLWWNKVYPMKIEAGRYGVAGEGTNKFEKIVLLYGPMLDIAACPTPATVQNIAAVDALTLDFDARLNQTLAALRQAKDGNYGGYLPVFPPIVINDDLNRGFLVNPDEFVLVENESAHSRTYARPEMDRSAGLLSLIHTDHIILDNYFADDIVTPAAVTPPGTLNTRSFTSQPAGIADSLSATIYSQLSSKGYIDGRGNLQAAIDYQKLRTDLATILSGQPDIGTKTESVVKAIATAAGTPRLSTAMRYQEYGLFTIKNHPGAFVFTGDKEAFLLAPDSQMPAISRAALNPDLLLTGNSFVSAAVNISATGSQAICDFLAQSGFTDDIGRIDPQLDIKDLRNQLNGQLNNPDQVDAAVNVIMHAPLFRSDAFVAPDPVNISPTGSKTMFDQLVAQGYLDKNGRLDADVDFHDLMDSVTTTLAGQPAQALKARFVVDILYQRASPSSLGFLDTSPAMNDAEYRFACVRLTTAAVHRLSSLLFTGGVDRLLSLESQQIPAVPELPFDRFAFSPTAVIAPDAIDGAQVDFAGAYKLYYWELFFHAPLLVANILKANQKFEDAQHWYRHIFDPTVPEQPIDNTAFVTTTIGQRDSARIFKALQDAKIITADNMVSADFSRDTALGTTLNFITDPVQIQSVRNILLNWQLSSRTGRFWQFRPFRNHKLETLHDQLTNDDEIARYNADPFDPDAIAALRIGAYEKAAVMQYVDNLLQWGDSLFSQYTWESIVAATMLYVSAYNLLGPRPENLGKAVQPDAMSFADILAKFSGKIPQFLLELEAVQQGGGANMTFVPMNAFDCYFCVPENTAFTAYWDRVEDRLYKIRHGLNIKGIPQVLALFEPPIDPALLVRAAAAGGDLLAQLAGQDMSLIYRFSAIVDRARLLASTASGLGQALLSALERKDGEELARLRATQESVILNLTTQMKQKQIEETKALLDQLKETRNGAQLRHDFYDSAYNENLNALEITDLTLRASAVPLQVAAIAVRGISIAAYLSPNIFGLADGGMQFGEAVGSGAQMLDGGSGLLGYMAGMIATGAQYERRRDDWGLQRDLAQSDLNQIDKQTASAQARLDLYNRELETHLKSIDQSGEYESYLKRKFTNQELYQWMAGRLSTLHFQTYRLALDMAFAAQAAYRSELDSTDQFVTLDYWDGLHQGLLAGDALALALNQMEAAYITRNARTLEIDKTVSLLQLDPVAFMKFKGGIDGAKKGELKFDLTEALFDFDFPGHYCRKIKAITVTIPAVIGPYQNINATLTQTENSIVLKPQIDAVKYLLKQNSSAPDGSIRKIAGTPQVALSRGVNDSGLFVLDFRDERFLPFEGTGAVSSWTLSLPPETNRIDFRTISDIILQIHYTARDGGPQLAGVRAALTSAQAPYPFTPAKIFDLKQAFSTEWSRFVSQPPQAGLQAISFALSDSIILPNLQRVIFKSADVLLLTADGSTVSDKNAGGFVKIKIGDGDSRKVPITNNRGTIDLSDLNAPGASCSLSFTVADAPDTLVTNNALNPAALASVVVVITYQSNVFTK